MAASTSESHRWHFFRAGGVDQVRLRAGADVVRLDELDQKLWVALSCPVKGIHFDERTLALLDTDGDGRVRAPEILSAVRWLRAVLKDPEVLVGGRDGVALSNLDEGTPEGREVLAAARHILEGLGKRDASHLTVADAAKTAEVFAQARLNGDGVVPVDALQDAGARAVAADILATAGGVDDRSGKPGYDRARLDAFFAALADFDAWWREGEADVQATWPLGEDTAAASAALEAVRAKVEDYFQRGLLAAYDPGAEEAVNRGREAFAAAVAGDLTASVETLRGFPLARVEPGRPLALDMPLNPAWRVAMARFDEAVVRPLLGEDTRTLDLEAWRALDARFASWRAWQASRRGAVVERLGIARVREILASDVRPLLEGAIQEDLSVAPTVRAIQQVERLARYQRDLHRLLVNYVSFEDFYGRRRAVFQAGTLYVDGRSSDLCVRVDDGAKHGLLAGMSKCYLVYADCTRPTGEKMTIAVALTAGDRDNLFVGRNGLFYDRAGRDWDATITKIVDNPISVRQAFWAPYKKVLRWIEDTVAKRAAAADEAATQRLQAAAEKTADGAKQGAPPPKPKFDVGVVAALGVAVGGITAAIGALLQSFFGLGFLMPLGVVGLLLLISGPSMLIAYLKLRQRNLGPILDANGWAVNTLTRVNLPLGRSLTAMAALPPGSTRSLKDPFAPKKSPWPRVLLVLLLLGAAGFGLWKTGLLSRWIPRIPAPEHPWEIGHASEDGTGPGAAGAGAASAPQQGG